MNLPYAVMFPAPCISENYSIKVVPNPVHSGKTIQIHAGFPEAELAEMKIRIFSMAGELIQEINSDKAITEIRLPINMTSATYIIQCDTGKHIKNTKIIVK